MDYFEQQRLNIEKGKGILNVLCGLNIFYRCISLFTYGFSARQIMNLIIFSAIMVGITKGNKLAKWLYLATAAAGLLMLFGFIIMGLVKGLYIIDVLLNMALLCITAFALTLNEKVIVYFDSISYARNFKTEKEDDSDEFYKDFYK